MSRNGEHNNLIHDVRRKQINEGLGFLKELLEINNEEHKLWGENQLGSQALIETTNKKSISQTLESMLLKSINTEMELQAAWQQNNQVYNLIVQILLKTFTVNEALRLKWRQNNQIDSMEVPTLLNVIRTNEALFIEWQRNNQIYNTAAQTFWKTIMINESLVALWLQNNQIKEIIKKKMLEQINKEVQEAIMHEGSNALVFSQMFGRDMSAVVLPRKNNVSSLLNKL